MNITYRGVVYRVTTKLQMLELLADISFMEEIDEMRKAGAA